MYFPISCAWIAQNLRELWSIIRVLYQRNLINNLLLDVLVNIFWQAKFWFYMCTYIFLSSLAIFRVYNCCWWMSDVHTNTFNDFRRSFNDIFVYIRRKLVHTDNLWGEPWKLPFQAYWVLCNINVIKWLSLDNYI